MLVSVGKVFVYVDIGEKGQPREGKSWSKGAEESQVPTPGECESTHRLFCPASARPQC